MKKGIDHLPSCIKPKGWSKWNKRKRKEFERIVDRLAELLQKEVESIIKNKDKSEIIEIRDAFITRASRLKR